MSQAVENCTGAEMYFSLERVITFAMLSTPWFKKRVPP